MTRMTWHKRFHGESLEESRSLSLEEHGALVRVVDLIYERDGRLPDDERFVCGWLGCTVRVWRRLRARLLDLGRLYVIDGLIRSVGSDEQLAAMAAADAQRRAAGNRSASIRRTFAESSPNISPNSDHVSWENKDLGSTPVERPLDRIKKEERETQSPIETQNPIPESETHTNKGEGVADAPPGGGRRYAFEGKLIKLNRKHYDEMLADAPHVAVSAELRARDEWLSSERATEADRKSWFPSTRKHIANLEQKALDRLAVAEADRVARCGTHPILSDGRPDFRTPYERYTDSLGPNSSVPRL